MKRMRTISSQFVLEQFRNGPEFELCIQEGETAWNPASTTQDIPGPATILYRQHPDGGVEAEVN